MTHLSKKQKYIVFCWVILTTLLFACIFIIDFFQLTQWQPFGSHMVDVYGILSAVGALGFVLEHYKKQKQ